MRLKHHVSCGFESHTRHHVDAGSARRRMPHIRSSDRRAALRARRGIATLSTRCTASRSRPSASGAALPTIRAATRPGRTAPCATLRRCRSTGDAYAALLGLYLGDGHIARSRSLLLPACLQRPGTSTDHRRRRSTCSAGSGRAAKSTQSRQPGCIVTYSDLEALALPLPAARPGPQARAPDRPGGVAARDRLSHPGPFLRGLFHSDGCRVNNWTTRVVAGEMKRYDYRAMAVHQPFRRHPRALLLGARPGRHPVAPVQPGRRSASRRRAAVARSTH